MSMNPHEANGHTTNGHPGNPDGLYERTIRFLREKYPERFAALETAPVETAGAESSQPALASVPRAPGTSPYARRALELECSQLAAAPAGTRNDQLNKAGFAVYQLVAGGELDEGEADSALRAAAEACGLSAAEITKTLRSAATEGRKQPRTAPKDGTAEEIVAPEIDIAVVGGKKGKAPSEPSANGVHEPTASPRAASSGPVQIRNYRASQDEKGSSSLVGRHPALIARDILAKTGGWPKVVGEHAIVPGDRPAQPYRFLSGPPDFFSWLQTVFPGERTQPGVDWTSGADKIPKDEFFAYMKGSACETYHTLELCPHWPKVPGVLYLHPELPAPTGNDLNAFMRRFFTAGGEDDDLLRSAVFTLLWGGSPGKRPGIMFSADGDGSKVGSGKSTVAQKISDLVGGYISAKIDSDQLETRLLSKKAMGKRVVLLDNLKSLHFSNMDIEGLVTSPTISGRGLYVGEDARPNLLTWIITVNDPCLSRDMAQRFVPIHVRRPVYGPSWDAETDAMIAERRWHIIADAITEMQQPEKELRVYTRYGRWNGDVLSRLPNPDALVTLIQSRQGMVDDDARKAEQMEDVIARALKAVDLDPDHARVFISSTSLYEIVKGYSQSGKGITHTLNGLYGLPTKRLKKGISDHRRGAIWNSDKDKDIECDYDDMRSEYAARKII